MRNIPERIYLQIGADFDHNVDFNKLVGVTHCVERVNKNDIEYVRVSNAHGIITSNEIEAVEKAAKKFAVSKTAIGIDACINETAFLTGASFLAQLRSEEKPSEELLDAISNLIWGVSKPLDSNNIQRAIFVEDLDKICKGIAKLTPKQDVNADAIRFSEWAACNGWSFNIRRKLWIKRISPNNERDTMTGKKLYELFQSAKSHILANPSKTCKS